MINYGTVEDVYNRNFGGEQLYKRPYCSNLVYTEGIMDFQKSLNAFWVVDNMVSYMPDILKTFKEIEDSFYVVEITVDKERRGYMEVYRKGYVEDEYSEHITVVKQDIPFIDLPTKADEEITSYKFFLELSSVNPTVFTLLLPREH